ncbi:MAG TPA: ABC transporter permease [Gemmatimonadales bacterium]|nr:ABC transporter permease [Gemmatimonadales bacterium]
MRAERFVPLIGAVAAGFAVLAITLLATGHDPILALGAMWRGAFGSWDTLLSAVLPRSVPLIIIGLGIGLAFRAGALNIGAEGQFYAGAIAATWAGLHLQGWPAPLAIASLLIASILAGMLWIAVPVLLRVRFGVLEVISTLLLNFVADALVSWMVQGPLQETKRIYPQSDPIALSARLPQLPGTRLHLGFLLAVLLALGLWLIYRRTLWGFQLRATGAGPLAARIAGRIDTNRMIATALLLSGGIAGLAGGTEVSGVSYALFQSLSPGYGFTGIAVALLARLDPLATIATGLLFAALEAGAGGLQREAGVPAVLVYLIEAVIIIVVLLSDAIARRRSDGRF